MSEIQTDHLERRVQRLEREGTALRVIVGVLALFILLLPRWDTPASAAGGQQQVSRLVVGTQGKNHVEVSNEALKFIAADGSTYAQLGVIERPKAGEQLGPYLGLFLIQDDKTHLSLVVGDDGSNYLLIEDHQAAAFLGAGGSGGSITLCDQKGNRQWGIP